MSDCEENTYRVPVHCKNCGFNGFAKVARGTMADGRHECSNCGCVAAERCLYPPPSALPLTERYPTNPIKVTLGLPALPPANDPPAFQPIYRHGYGIPPAIDSVQIGDLPGDGPHPLAH